MGDSYAAGLGAGSMIESFDATCFRYDGAYPVLLNGHLQPRPSRFNFVACSGDNFPTILQKQLNPSYLRPRWGDRPEFVTLSMGGNDIGFKELVTLCVYSIPLSPLMDCAGAIARSQRLVRSDDFTNDAINVIVTILRKAADRGIPNFKIYVTGYAQFFNERTTQCNSISFRPSWVKLKPKEYLTIDRRRTLNRIAWDLNVGLREAVMRASFGAPNRVFFIDYDRAFEGHRFCDRVEPNPDDANTWFLTYGSHEAEIGDFLDSIPQIHDVLNGHSNRTFSYDTFVRLILNATADDEEKMRVGGYLTRVFHPTLDGQRAIEERLRNVVLATRILEGPTATTEIS
ncbi:MAG: hypothetical protein Q9200_001694 [Gallowayella weberi]